MTTSTTTTTTSSTVTVRYVQYTQSNGQEGFHRIENTPLLNKVKALGQPSADLQRQANEAEKAGDVQLALKLFKLAM